jgi:hypothetical protein
MPAGEGPSGVGLGVGVSNLTAAGRPRTRVGWRIGGGGECGRALARGGARH